MSRMDDEMNRMEDALRKALRRREAPEGLADRVLARIAQHRSLSRTSRDSWLGIFRYPLLRWASAAALSVVLVAGGVHYRNVRRAEGEAAKQRLMLALRIAGSKLQLARSKVNQSAADQTENRDVKE